MRASGTNPARRQALRLGLACAFALIACLGVTAQASAAATISGKLSKRGYKVVAISERGKVATASARRGSFKVRAPARVVALHLLDKRGHYAGPVVMDTTSSGRKAVLGVKAGAKLGLVEVKSGYARTAKRAARRFASRSIVAKAKDLSRLGGGNGHEVGLFERDEAAGQL